MLTTGPILYIYRLFNRVQTELTGCISFSGRHLLDISGIKKIKKSNFKKVPKTTNWIARARQTTQSFASTSPTNQRKQKTRFYLRAPKIRSWFVNIVVMKSCSHFEKQSVYTYFDKKTGQHSTIWWILGLSRDTLLSKYSLCRWYFVRKYPLQDNCLIIRYLFLA